MTAKTDIWRQLTQFVSSTEATLTKIFQTKHGIGLSEFLALGHLAAAENEELRMQDLSARLQLNQSSVTRLVERLERMGLTRRDVCPDDKRGVYTVLNESGRRMLEQAKPDYEGHILDALRSEEMRATVRSILE